MKQGRLNFSDYTAEQQERDARRSRFRQVYLMKVDGEWGHLTIIDGELKADFHKGDLTQTYYELKAEFPTHHVSVIRNQGLENYLRDKRPEIMMRKQKDNPKQLKIPFKDNYEY